MGSDHFVGLKTRNKDIPIKSSHFDNNFWINEAKIETNYE